MKDSLKKPKSTLLKNIELMLNRRLSVSEIEIWGVILKDGTIELRIPAKGNKVSMKDVKIGAIPVRIEKSMPVGKAFSKSFTEVRRRKKQLDSKWGLK
jgi:hypothetical protein